MPHWNTKPSKRFFFCVVCAVQIMIIEFFYWHYKFLYFFLLNSISKTLLAWEIEASNIFCVCFFEINRKNDFFIVEIYYWSWCAEIKWRQHDFHFVNLVLLIDFFFLFVFSRIFKCYILYPDFICPTRSNKKVALNLRERTRFTH